MIVIVTDFKEHNQSMAIAVTQTQWQRFNVMWTHFNLLDHNSCIIAGTGMMIYLHISYECTYILWFLLASFMYTKNILYEIKIVKLIGFYSISITEII